MKINLQFHTLYYSSTLRLPRPIDETALPNDACIIEHFLSSFFIIKSQHITDTTIKFSLGNLGIFIIAGALIPVLYKYIPLTITCEYSKNTAGESELITKVHSRDPRPIFFTTDNVPRYINSFCAQFDSFLQSYFLSHNTHIISTV